MALAKSSQGSGSQAWGALPPLSSSIAPAPFFLLFFFYLPPSSLPSPPRLPLPVLDLGWGAGQGPVVRGWTWPLSFRGYQQEARQ